jgi:hypothetical protein
MATAQSPEKVVREISRRTRKKYGTEEKIRIVLEGLKGEASIAELCGVPFPSAAKDVSRGCEATGSLEHTL